MVHAATRIQSSLCATHEKFIIIWRWWSCGIGNEAIGPDSLITIMYLYWIFCTLWFDVVRINHLLYINSLYRYSDLLNISYFYAISFFFLLKFQWCENHKGRLVPLPNPCRRYLTYFASFLHLYLFLESIMLTWVVSLMP